NPRLPASRADRDQEIFEPGLLGGIDDALAEFRRAGNLRLHQAIGRGVAMGRQVPAEFERSHRGLLTLKHFCAAWRLRCVDDSFSVCPCQRATTSIMYLRVAQPWAELPSFIPQIRRLKLSGPT